MFIVAYTDFPPWGTRTALSTSVSPLLTEQLTNTVYSRSLRLGRRNLVWWLDRQSDASPQEKVRLGLVGSDSENPSDSHRGHGAGHLSDNDSQINTDTPFHQVALGPQCSRQQISARLNALEIRSQK